MVTKLLTRLWAGPATLLGLLVAPLFARRRVIGSALVCEGASWPRRLGWGYRAITFGHVILSVDELDDAVLAHELAHVAQYERWGILLWPAYLLCSLWALVRGHHYHRDNAFEVAARRAGGRPRVSGGGA